MRPAITFETPTDGAALQQLRPTVEQIFGGARTRGWWARKLRREGAQPRLCVVARSGDGEAVAYGLAGKPYGAAGPARAVTMGVRPDLRGQGIGTAVWREVLARAHAAHARVFELSAQPELVSFYEGLGFRVRERAATWRRPPLEGGGLALAFGASANWELDGPIATQWLERAWRETPRAQRSRLRTEGCAALVSLEPGGMLVQRLALPSGAQEGVTTLARAAPGAPLLVYGVVDDETTSALRERLLAHGFVPAQHFVRMQRVLDDPT